VLELDADSAVLPLVDGWIGILPGRAPFVARVVPGEVLVTSGGQEQSAATTGGVVKVADDEVVVLAGNAIVGVGLDELRSRMNDESRQLALLELQAEKRIEALYRQMAGVSRRTGTP